MLIGTISKKISKEMLISLVISLDIDVISICSMIYNMIRSAPLDWSRTTGLGAGPGSLDPPPVGR